MAAWKAVVENDTSYKRERGLGGFVRSESWDEVNEITAAANVYTIQVRPGPRARLLADPGDVDGLHAAGSRYLSLIGGVCMSFYDWYCDLPPASPMTWASRPTCRNRPTGTTRLSS